MKLTRKVILSALLLTFTSFTFAQQQTVKKNNETKKETQEELFNTFEALYNSNKQLVFTCDRPVTELKDMNERLISRFGRGLSVDLQAPQYETRLAILQKQGML